MRLRFLLATSCLWLAGVASLARAVDLPVVRPVESDARTGAAAAVVVDDLPLVYTSQFLPDVKDSPDDRAQVARVLEALDGSLKTLDGSLKTLDGKTAWLRLHFYIKDASLRPIVQAALARRFDGITPPAVTYVVTKLPRAGVRVAADGVAAIVSPIASAQPKEPTIARHAPAGLAQQLASPGAAVVTVAPAGQRLYISGQAEPGELVEATRKTLEGLRRTLEEYQLTLAHTTEVKCFLQPMDRCDEVSAEIKRFFGDAQVAVSHVDWTAGVIEIELVAWAGPARADGPVIEFLTPPWMQPSPVFCRVTRVARGGTIFLGDMHCEADAATEAQIVQPFERMKTLLAKCGSDLKHLAKATYYVTGNEVNAAHNKLRPNYYDPERPPAASKAPVAHTGREGVHYVMDMIAVPSSGGTPRTGPERGAGLSEEQAAEGWVSLFDGSTGYGWNGAAVKNGLLKGGTSTTRFGPSTLVLDVAEGGTAEINDQRITLEPGEQEFQLTGRRAIALGPGVGLRAARLLPIGTRPLFNGRDLDGWKRIEHPSVKDINRPQWSFEDGVLRVVGGPGCIEYQPRQLADFALQIDIRTRAVHSNGGVFVRSIRGDFLNGYELQLHNRCVDDDPARPYVWATGGVDDRLNARRLVPRDFVTFRMTVMADGPHLATWVNGYQTVDWTDERADHDNPREGRRLKAGALQLQAHDPLSDYEIGHLAVAAWDE